MTAVLVPTASEAEWLERRREGVTASEIPVLMGLSPYSSPYKLFHQKLGILPAEDDSDVMEKGRVLEPVIAEKFGKLHPEYAVIGDGRALWRHSDRKWQMATPDRMVHEVVEVDGCTCGGGLDGYGHEPRCGWELDRPVAVLECKVDGGSDDWGEPGTDEIPVHYRAQVLWQCRVMGVSRWHAGCFNADRWRARWYTGTIDAAAEADLRLMEDEARDFLDRVDSGDPPDVDWRPATLDALKTLHPSVEDTGIFVSTQLASRYRAAVRNAKHWEQRKKLYEAQLRERMGPHRRAHVRSDAIPGGEVIARRDVYEVREHVRRASTVDKLVPVYPKDKKNAGPDSE